MSRKSNVSLFADPAISKQDMSASFNGTPFELKYQDDLGVQLSWSGANPLGTITLEVSLDYDPLTNNGTNGPGVTWTTFQTVPGTDLTVTPGTVGNPGSAYLDLALMSASYVRVVYTTAGSSVGVLTAKLSAKML